MGKISLSIVLVCFTLLGMVYGEESMSMSAADKAMYDELRDNNPADMELSEGETLFDALIGKALYAKMMGGE